MPNPPLIVIDTDVLVSTAAQLSSSLPPAVWSAVLSGTVVAVTSNSLLSELIDVAQRPKVLSALPRLKTQFPMFLAEYQARAKILIEPAEQFVLADDPKDSRLFNLAIAADAAAIVSFDRKHVLAIGDPLHSQHQQLKQLAPRLRLIHPNDFLRNFPAAPG